MTIEEKELTFQLGNIDEQGNPTGNPSVADGTEISVYAETMNQIFKKEPNFTSIQRSGDDKVKGSRTKVVDSLDAEHTFEISAWVYNDRNKPRSLDPGILNSNNNGVKTAELYEVEDPDEFRFLGDTEIKFDSETVVRNSDGVTLSRGTDYVFDYERGRIKFLRSSSNVNTELVNVNPVPGLTNKVPRITDSYVIDYTFNGRPSNIGNLLKRMAQLGGPVIMRKNKSSFTAESGKNGTPYPVVPTNVDIEEKSSKPDEVKMSIEARVARSFQ
jgi:hypothetical protein